MYSMHTNTGGRYFRNVLTFSHPSVAWEGAWSESARPHQWVGLTRGLHPQTHGVGYRKAA